MVRSHELVERPHQHDEEDTQPQREQRQRQLNKAFRETLRGLDDARRVIRYSIDDGPGAVARDNVTGYLGEVSVFPITDTNSTFVLWTSSWEDSKGGVADFCNPIYRALLEALKKHFA